MDTDTKNPEPPGPVRPARVKPTVDPETFGRLAKYAVLLVLVLVNLRLVFDGYSFYIARRDIDSELQSKRISSLEYLTVLSRRERALALSTLEARCLERAQLTLFRLFEVENDAIQKAYSALIVQKNAMIKILEESGRDPVKVRKVTDFIDGIGFELTRLDEQLKVLEDGTGGSDDFEKLKARLAEPRKKYVEVAMANAPLRQRVEERIRDKDSPPASYWTTDAIKAVVARIDQLRAEQKANRERLGNIDDLIARYTVWTRALTGSAADILALDDVAYQIGQDDRRLLREAKCDRFKEYYAAVNGQAADSSDVTSYYSQFLLRYFEQPPSAQTLFVTLLLGALGALTLNVLRMSKVGWWADHPDPLWGEIVVGQVLGALAAFGIFLVGSAGLLLTSDSHGAQPLSTYFIGLLGFLSGLLYDEAFGRVRRIGIQMFSTTSDVQIANARAEDRTLAEALKSASAGRAAGLVLKYGIGTRLGIEGEFTMLIPSDEAIGELTLATWTRLNDEPTAFERWYHHHHAGKRVTRADVAAAPPVKELATDDGGVLALEVKDDALTIADIRVVIPDVKWGKGVVHILQRDLG